MFLSLFNREQKVLDSKRSWAYRIVRRVDNNNHIGTIHTIFYIKKIPQGTNHPKLIHKELLH